MAAAKLQGNLPQFVVLRSKGDGNCLQYLWNEEEFGDYYKCMATKRAVDPVSPFAKLEIVPSTGSPGANIHLRSAYNNKYLKPVKKDGIWFLSATADSPNDDMGLVGTSTLFEAFTPSDLPNTVYFRYVANQYYFYIGTNAKLPALDKVACIYSTDRSFATYFEYAAWESYDDKMKAKDAEIQSRDVEIQNLKDKVATKDAEIQSLNQANAKLKDEIVSREKEVQGLKDQVAAKEVEIKSRDEEIQELKDQVVAKDGDIVKLEGEVAAWKAYEEERKAKLEEEMKKLQAAWDSFQVDVTAGIDPPKD